MVELTQEEKMKRRILIAKDALKWLKAGALKAATGTYVYILDRSKFHTLETMKSVQARDVCIGKCEVCAKGALFLAHAVRYNNVSVGDVLFSRFECALYEEFDGRTLNRIEAAFEGWPSVSHGGIYNYDYAWTLSKYPNSEVRLINILKNIIKNKGDFDTEKYPLV